MVLIGRFGTVSILAFMLAVTGCENRLQISQDGLGQADNGSSVKSTGNAKMLMVDPVTAVSAGLSIASSLKGLFGKDANARDLKKIRAQLDQIAAQNAQILQTLGEIVTILNNLGVTIRQNVRLETIFEKQARLMSESWQLQETWIAEIEDKRAARQAAERYRLDILPDVRDVTHELMDEGYGYSAYDTVGHGMMMQFWMSRRLAERPSIRRNEANSYVAYFDRALNPATPGSPGKLLSDAQAQRARLKPILDAADQTVGTNGWEVAVRDYQWHESRGRRTTYRNIRVFEKATGNQQDGYVLNRREAILREWVETEPSDGPHCGMCRDLVANKEGSSSRKSLGTDPAAPNEQTPAARVNYWNAVRTTLAAADGEIAIWSKVAEALRLYRNEAQAVAGAT